MWSGLLNRKKDKTKIFENSAEEELNPMLFNDSSQPNKLFSEYENNHVQTQVVEGIDINIDSIDEFVKVTNDIYVCNCSDISVDFLQSVGFNCIIHINSEKNVLPPINNSNTCEKFMNITLDNIEKSSTHNALKKFITDGLQTPKVIINFTDAKIMIITVLHYLIVHKLSGSDFVHAYNPEALPNEHLNVLYKLLPELNKYRTNENFTILVDMFPDIQRSKLEQMYKDSGEDIEYVTSMIFS
jgi:hypothetical protein